MDYEKKYKEALERAREYHSVDIDNTMDIKARGIMEYLFPELEESEDEKIRKSLISYLHGLGEFDYPDKKTYHDWLEWLEKQKGYVSPQMVADAYLRGCNETEEKLLEKQGEQKPAKTVKWSPQEESCICQLESLVKEQWRQAECVHNSVNIKKMQELMFFLKTLNPNKKPQRMISAEAKEAMYKKPADKVEPKFKAGDWIVFNGFTLYIKEVVKGFYRTISKGGITNSYDWDIDNAARLWTIQDAKEGDVLSCGDKISCPFIFHNLTEKLNPRAYCGVNTLFHFQYNNENCGHWCYSNEVRPSTKEECDLLFAKMKEAGYEWDADKKELKKISQRMISAEAKEAMYAKTAWSEDDEKMLVDAYVMLDWYKGNNWWTARRIKDWLNSLKERIGG